MTTQKFETGKTYSGMLACCSDLSPVYKVVRRTEKTVWVEHHGNVVMRRVSDCGAYESFSDRSVYVTAGSLLREVEEVEEIDRNYSELIQGDYNGVPLNDDVDYIMIHWHEGYDRVQEGAKFGSLKSAHEAVKHIVHEDELRHEGYTKVKFEIVFRNGRESWEGRLDLSRSEDNPYAVDNIFVAYAEEYSRGSLLDSLTRGGHSNDAGGDQGEAVSELLVNTGGMELTVGLDRIQAKPDAIKSPTEQYAEWVQSKINSGEVAKIIPLKDWIDIREA